MGRQVDLDSPLSEEDKEYLRNRGRGYLIHANERRFGVHGDETPAEGEEAGVPTARSFYDNSERERAVYDVGGAPLPGTVLDKDTGRVLDRDNGVIVEYTGPGHTQSAHDLSAQRGGDFENGASDDGDDIDQDIAEFVLSKSQTNDKLRDRLDKEKVEYKSDDNKQVLQERLAIKLQDDRDSGKEVKLS